MIIYLQVGSQNVYLTPVACVFDISFQLHAGNHDLLLK